MEVFLFRFSDFGTMLEIRGIQYFEDGQSVLDTVGGRRFKVLERDVRDGYQTANVEFLEDAIPADSDVEELQVNSKVEMDGLEMDLNEDLIILSSVCTTTLSPTRSLG